MFGLLSKILAPAGRSSAAPVRPITFDDLRARLADGDVLLVDVRERGEYAAGHAAGSINAPLSSLSAARLPEAGGKQIVLICQAGGRSAMGIRRLQAEGRADVDTHFAPGFAGWRSLGGRVE